LKALSIKNPKETFMRSFPTKLSACAIAAAALLSACGGGGTTADTTAPTVTITDNVSATTTGDVTFTFTFSEAVTGFVADDVAVTGGTKGTFTMASDGKSATLVVSPTANATGTIAVNVAASTFSDGSSNTNTAAATGSQAFNTQTTPTPTTNLITNGSFDNGSVGWSGNAANVRTGETFNFADVPAAGNPYDVNLSYVLPILNSGVNYKLTFKASSNRARTLVAGIGLNQAPWTNASQTVNLTTTEQTFVLNLTSNFASATSRIIFDMGADTGHVVIDDVMLEIDNSVVAAGPTAAAPAPTAAAANVSSIFSDAYTSVSGVSWGPDWGPSSARISDATLAGTKYIDLTAGKVFAGISYTASPINATNHTHFNMHYWIDTPVPAGQVINVKLSNHAAGTGETSAIEMPTLTSVTGGSWQTLSVPLANFTIAGGGSASRDKIAEVIITATRTDGNQSVKFYFDNIYFSTNP
jgi:endoglucanase